MLSEQPTSAETAAHCGDVFGVHFLDLIQYGFLLQGKPNHSIFFSYCIFPFSKNASWLTCISNISSLGILFSKSSKYLYVQKNWGL